MQKYYASLTKVTDILNKGMSAESLDSAVEALEYATDPTGGLTFPPTLPVGKGMPLDPKERKGNYPAEIDGLKIPPITKEDAKSAGAAILQALKELSPPLTWGDSNINKAQKVLDDQGVISKYQSTSNPKIAKLVRLYAPNYLQLEGSVGNNKLASAFYTVTSKVATYIDRSIAGK